MTIAVEGREDKPIYCYRLAGPGAPEIRVGSKISVKGTLKNYNGTIEFDKGCQLLSTHAEVQPFTTLELEASFDKTSVAVGENVTLSFTTIQDCVTGHRFTVVQRIYDEQNETCYKTTCAFFPVYGGEYTFRPEFGTRLEYELRLFDINSNQVYDYAISIPITGAQADTAPTIKLSNYPTETVLGKPFPVMVNISGYMSSAFGCWYVDTGSGFQRAGSSIKLRNSDTVTFTPTSGTRFYFEAEGNTDSGVLTVRTPVIPITDGFPVVPGDADANGTLDLLDALLILQYEAGWDVTPEPLSSDIHRDWKINAQDALAILNQLSGQ